MQKEPAQLFFVEPMECKEVRNVRDIPGTDDWQYELKYDGYRCVATIRKGEVTLYSHNGNVFVQFPNVEAALGKIKVTTLILDGEIVALTEEGRSDFNALQRTRTKPIIVHFYIFDLLHLNGKDLRAKPLAERQQLLWKTFPELPDYLHHSKPLLADLDTVMEKIQEFGFEGIVAKKKDSIYTPGNAPGSWLKRKLKQTDEFIIGGYTPGNNGVDKILIGKYHHQQLMFVDALDDGFIPATRRQVFKAIEKLTINECPFTNLPEKKGRGRMDNEKMTEVTWVKPKIVVEVAMNEWTPAKHLRHAEFRRLRPDKTTKQVSPYPAV